LIDSELWMVSQDQSEKVSGCGLYCVRLKNLTTGLPLSIRNAFFADIQQQKRERVNSTTVRFFPWIECSRYLETDESFSWSGGSESWFCDT
jgi:hypothetical protein